MKRATRIACLGVGCVCLALAASPAMGQGIEPAGIPQPQFDFANAPRALIVTTNLFGDGSAQLISLDISNGPAPSYVADPPLLSLTYFSGAELLGQRNAWDPRWLFEQTGSGGEHLEVLAEAEGVFYVPLSIELSRVVIADQQTGMPLLDLDVSATVQAFCDANPEEMSCASDVLMKDGFE